MSEIRRINCGTGNCYIVTDGSNAILVDTGSKENIKDVMAECDKYDMKLIVLTHVHFDHAENASVLSEKYNIPVAIHPLDEELFDSYDKHALHSYGLIGKIILVLSVKKLSNIKIEKPKNLIFVKDKDELSKYGVNATIIELPGHTKGSIGVDTGQGIIVGDALDNWIFPATGHLYNDINEIKKTAEKIKALGERTLYYGHGKPSNNSFKMLK